MLRSQDIAVTLKYLLVHEQYPTFEEIAQTIGMTASNVHLAVKRSIEAKLLEQPSKRSIKPIRNNILEFVTHGARFAFYPERGGMARGMPTAHSAPPLSAVFMPDLTPPVWEDANGNAFGTTLEPLFKTAAFAAQQDPKFYELLALVDALRIGKTRERKLAADYLKKRLEDNWS